MQEISVTEPASSIDEGAAAFAKTESAPAASTAASAGSAGSGPTYDVSVVDPKKIGDGIFGSYVGFTVKTKRSNGEDLEVLRRYSDFLWLRDILVKEFPNKLVPPMPPKHAVGEGKYDPLFLEVRRSDLQRFLSRVAKNPKFNSTTWFLTFVEVGTSYHRLRDTDSYHS